MKKLIINCDDFGISRGINYGIIDLHQAGVLTSTTLLVNAPAVDHAIALFRANPTLGVGLHLCLTMFKPCTDIAVLCGPNGEMNRKNDLYAGLVVDSDLIYQEWKAQLEKFIQMVGQKPTHLDTHHHVHEIAYIKEVAIRLSNEYALPLRGMANNFGAVALSKDFYGDNCSVEFFKKELLKLLATPHVDAYEFSCHVGYIDETIKQVTTYNTNRSLELANLLNPEVLDFIQKQDVILCRFDQIRE